MFKKRQFSSCAYVYLCAQVVKKMRTAFLLI